MITVRKINIPAIHILHAFRLVPTMNVLGHRFGGGLLPKQQAETRTFFTRARILRSPPYLRHTTSSSAMHPSSAISARGLHLSVGGGGTRKQARKQLAVVAEPAHHWNYRSDLLP
jgi:hypothetical protein